MEILKHEMSEELAIRLLGWKWMSFVGMPVNTAKDYPKKCRVRQLLSARQLKSPSWIDHLETNEGSEATGDEPLAYTYCSSGAHRAELPRFIILMEERYP